MIKKKTVFVIHGRNGEARESMFVFLQSIGLSPLEWEEIVAKTGEGSPYIGTVLEKGFSISQAAIVLMTPDDEAQLRESFRRDTEPDWENQLTPQPRQNVLFEAGMAMGKFPDRTIIVELGKLRPFSDVLGRHVIRIDDSSQKRQEIANRLETAGCTINLKGIRWHTAGKFNLEKTEVPIKSIPKDTENHNGKEKNNLSSGFSQLALDCGVSVEQLKDAISMQDEKIELLSSFTGSDAKKQIHVAQCVLIAYETIFKNEWTKASLLNERLDELGIQNLGNLASNLQKYPLLFRKRGSGKATEYKLTTANGRTSARRIMYKLVKGEPLDES